ncbi:MAG: malonyl-CoA decarboxylase [Pseudomonadota bacterium]
MLERDEPLWDRTLRRIRLIWPLGDQTALKNSVNADLPDGDLQKLRERIDACLEGRGGEVSARTRAAELGETYLVLNPQGRKRFLELLAREYDVNNEAIEAAITTRFQGSEQDSTRLMNHALRKLLVPPRTQLLRQFNGLQEGVKFLVDLRAELLPLTATDSALKSLDQDILGLLCSWFDVGFLDLQRITWETPAALLEKLIKYEAVHAIRSWQDLKNRLREDRRCFAYFHPRMPQEPLIFVEVALVNGIADNIHDLLDESKPTLAPRQADCAIFYSISNCQAGLAGVGFGNFLIKNVVKDLSAKLPNLKTFSTLSPIPGFLSYLRMHPEEVVFSERDLKALGKMAGETDAKEFFLSAIGNLSEYLTEEKSSPLKPILLQLCAKYLLLAKKGRQAFDRVSHFHLSNGAKIERINWAADLSEKGIKQSAGIMVNYLYQLSQIEKNHENYTGNGDIAVSSAVSKMAKL